MKVPSIRISPLVFPLIATLSLAACSDHGHHRDRQHVSVRGGYYSPEPEVTVSSVYIYGGRSYSGGRYETGRYRYNNRDYNSRYYHQGRYIYGGTHHPSRSKTSQQSRSRQESKYDKKEGKKSGHSYKQSDESSKMRY